MKKVRFEASTAQMSSLGGSRHGKPGYHHRSSMIQSETSTSTQHNIATQVRHSLNEIDGKITIRNRDIVWSLTMLTVALLLGQSNSPDNYQGHVIFGLHIIILVYLLYLLHQLVLWNSGHN
jgi:hypothetical protein